MPNVVHPDPDCSTCRAFFEGLETLPMDGVAWQQRGKLRTSFIWYHHVPMFDDIRAWVMLTALRDGGWRLIVLVIIPKVEIDEKSESSNE